MVLDELESEMNLVSVFIYEFYEYELLRLPRELDKAWAEGRFGLRLDIWTQAGGFRKRRMASQRLEKESVYVKDLKNEISVQNERLGRDVD